MLMQAVAWQIAVFIAVSLLVATGDCLSVVSVCVVVCVCAYPIVQSSSRSFL